MIAIIIELNQLKKKKKKFLKNIIEKNILKKIELKPLKFSNKNYNQE